MAGNDETKKPSEDAVEYGKPPEHTQFKKGQSVGNSRRCRMGGNDQTKKPGEDAVGYGKPPKHTRFKKGHSGNPKGRPKGSLNSDTVFKRTARQPIVINENGQRKIVTVLEAAHKQLANKAVSGDVPALRTYLDRADVVEQRSQEEAKPSARVDDADQKVVMGLVTRLTRNLKGEPDK